MNIKNNYPHKYQKLLENDIWQFIKTTASFYPPNASRCTMKQQRGFYNKMCKHFFNGYPRGVKSQNKKIKKLKLRNYFCGDGQAHIIYFHGGGFVLGGLESHDDICAELCAATGFGLTSVDYRLAPEYNFPADFNDAVCAFNYVREKYHMPIIVMGDSAGATLAASLSSKFRKKICGQVLIYPALGGEYSKGSFATHAHAPILSRAQVDFYMASRTGTNIKWVNKNGRLPKKFFTAKCLPLYEKNFATLPPTIIFTAESDPLCDDGMHYAKKMKRANGKVKLFNEKGLIHGYLRARHIAKKARASFGRIIKAVKMLGEGGGNF